MPTAQPNQSVRNGFDVLQLLAASPEPLATGDIAAAARLGKSVASRLLLTLEEVGYVLRVGHGRWRPHVGLLALGALGLKNSPLLRCRPILEELASGVPCLVALGFVWHEQVVYLFQSADARRVGGFGQVWPVATSSIGQLLAAKRRPAHKLLWVRGGREFTVAVPLSFAGVEYGLAMAGEKREFHGDDTIQRLRAHAQRIADLDVPDRRAP
jgi:DNA-binding IclR family transcriptional regulator